MTYMDPRRGFHSHLHPTYVSVVVEGVDVVCVEHSSRSRLGVATVTVRTGAPLPRARLPSDISIQPLCAPNRFCYGQPPTKWPRFSLALDPDRLYGEIDHHG